MTIIDPFCGSGSLALACVKNDRRYLCCDIDEQYIKMAKANISLGWEICQKMWGEKIDMVRSYQLF